MVVEEKNGVLWARPCVCTEQKALNRRIKASGLSAEQRKVRLEHFEVSAATLPMYLVVKEYLEEFAALRVSESCGKGFGLCGSPGVGKTMLALAATNVLLDQKVPTVFVVAPDLMAELRVAQCGGSGAELEDKLHRIAAAPVCVFDDLGREKVSEWVQTQYYRIIDKRWRDKLPTIFTSNHGWDDIAKVLGEAVASRLYALTQGRQVFMAAPDRRVWRDERREAAASARQMKLTRWFKF